MFGRVVINKPEMKFREFDVYRSYYCGLCGELRKKGYLTAMCLSYDMTFLSMLLNSLYEPTDRQKECRCICHMCKKHTETQDEFTRYVAHMSILMAYYKALDDFHDDKSIIKFLYSLYLKPQFKKISKLYPEKSSTIKKHLEDLSRSEKGTDLEECANHFGIITAALFTPRDDLWKDILRNMGFYLGKFIYIADAYTDIEEDIKKGRHNPLRQIYETQDFDRECNIILNMMAAHAADEFEKLPIIKNAEILRNILYSGMWHGLELQADQKGKTK